MVMAGSDPRKLVCWLLASTLHYNGATLYPSELHFLLLYTFFFSSVTLKALFLTPGPLSLFLILKMVFTLIFKRHATLLCSGSLHKYHLYREPSIQNTCESLSNPLFSFSKVFIMKLSLLSILCASSSNNPTEKKNRKSACRANKHDKMFSTFHDREENHQDHNKITILDLFDWQKLKCDITKSWICVPREYFDLLIKSIN